MAARITLTPVVLFLLCALFLAPAPAHAQQNQSNLTIQQNDNRQWEDAAKKLEADLVAEGQRCQSAKNFARAGDLYRRALSITYEQWDIQEVRSVGGSVTYQTSLRKIRKKLDTSNTKSARDKLGGLDAAILAENESLFRKNATTWTTEARAAVKDKKPEGYVKAYVAYDRVVDAAARLPQSKFATQESEKAQAEMKKIIDIADAPLAEAEKTLKDGKIPDALAKLDEFTQTWRVVAEDNPDMRKRVGAIRSDPDVRKYQREQDATKRLASGDAALEKGDYVSAMRHYRSVIVNYADLDVSLKASEKLADLLADPKAADDLKELDAETRCRVTLAKVDSLMRLKKYKEADALCRKLIADNPDTPWATRASESLAAIKRATGE